MPGGVFNCASANFSPETQRILKVLMEEAKLSIKTRTDLEKRILSGGPLPKPKVRIVAQPTQNVFGTKKNYHFAKRTFGQIQNSGAYDVECYRPIHIRVDRTKEKEALQNIMAFGDKGEQTQATHVRKKGPRTFTLTRQKRIEELSDEIQDRMTFLQDMRTLGEAARYEQDMKQEIAAKLRELNRLQQLTDEDFEGCQTVSFP